MAGEVKYDSLPFIDSSGKDVFESGDDFQETNYENIEYSSDAVEHITLDTSKSFNVFRNKYLDTTNTDFSDRIRSSHKGGYQAKSVYEIIGEQVAKETPQQKYQRLQLELKELAEEIEEIKDASSSDNQINPVTLANQVSSLQKELHDLHLEKVLGPDVVSVKGVQPGTWKKDILNQLDSLKSHQTSAKTESEENIVYQLHYKPEHTKFAQAAKIMELEAKLKEIETYVGDDKQTLQTVIADERGSNNLTEVAASIKAKLSLFDITHIDIIATRLQGLLHCINEISQKKDAMEHVENQSKINELHQLITSWDSVATVVPDLIDQLKSLHALNEQALTFSQSLEHLTTTQTEVRDQLRVQNDTLNKFECSFADNLDVIQTNCATLETRINNLMSKISK